MKKIPVIIQITILLFLRTAITFANDPHENQALSKLWESMSGLEKQVSKHTQTAQYCPPPPLATNPTCSWLQVCQRLQLSNFSTNSYESPKGGAIANRNLSKANFEVTSCANSIANEASNLSEQVHKDLQTFLIAHPNDNALYDQFIKTIVDQATEPNEEKSSSFVSQLNDKTTNAITAFEQSTKTKFSADARLLIQKAVRHATTSKAIDSSRNTIRKPFQVNPTLDYKYYNEGAPGEAELPSKLERMKSAFSKATQLLSAQLKKRHETSPSPVLTAMLAKLEKTHIYFENGSECAAGPNAYYNTSANFVHVCPQLLTWPENTLLTTMLHELGHAIDPCTMNKESRLFFQEHPFKNIVACLLGKKSVNAIGSLDPINDPVPTNADEKNKADRLKKEKTVLCSDWGGPPQIQESFADWVAYDTMGTYVKHLPDDERSIAAFETVIGPNTANCATFHQSAVDKLNALRSQAGCKTIPGELAYLTEHPTEPESKDSYPRNEDRLNRIALANSDLKRALGCQKDNNSNGKAEEPVECSP